MGPENRRFAHICWESTNKNSVRYQRPIFWNMSRGHWSRWRCQRQRTFSRWRLNTNTQELHIVSLIYCTLFQSYVLQVYSFIHSFIHSFAQSVQSNNNSEHTVGQDSKGML